MRLPEYWKQSTLYQLQITLLGCATPFSRVDLAAVLQDAGAQLDQEIEGLRLEARGLTLTVPAVRINLARSSTSDAIDLLGWLRRAQELTRERCGRYVLEIRGDRITTQTISWSDRTLVVSDPTRERGGLREPRC
jgi:hypothetical protein